MFSATMAPANVLRRRVLVGSWLLHAGLWLAIALFPMILRRALAEEASIQGLDASAVIDRVLKEQVQALSRFFAYAIILCLGLSLMGLLWAWYLLNQKPRAWRWAIGWLAFEYLALCWVIRLVTSTPDWQDSTAPTLLGSDRPWFVGFIIAHMLLMGLMPFVHLWARLAYELRPGEHSDADRLRWWLSDQAERLLKLLFRRRKAEDDRVTDRRPPPVEIPEDIERRQMWPSAPLPPPADEPPPGSALRPLDDAPPDDGYLRS